jgi:type I restriction enzyme S subunit
MERAISWESRKINDLIIDMKSGFSFPKNKLSDTGTGQLRPYNITTSLALDLSSLVYIPENTQGIDIQSYFLKKGDVLFNNTNSRELVGKTAITEEDIDVGFSNHITRIRVDQAIVEPKWFALCLHRHWVFGTFEANCKRWIGQAALAQPS